MERWPVTIEANLHVIRVYALDPSSAHFLFHGSASKLQPRLAEVIAEPVRSSRPDQDWCLIGHCPEPGFALKESFFGALSLRDVTIYCVVCDVLARGRSDRDREKEYMNIGSILAPADGFDLYALSLLKLSGIFPGALNQSLGDDDIINRTPCNFVRLVTEYAGEFLADTKDAVVRVQNSNRFRSRTRMSSPGCSRPRSETSATVTGRAESIRWDAAR